MIEMKAFTFGLGQYLEDGSPCVVAFDGEKNPRLASDEKFYLKSEVDKVIAEKDKQIEELKHQRDGAFGLTNLGLTLDDLSQMARKQIAHQKYKRCLAMAAMCKARYDEEDAKENWCGLSWEYISKEMKYWERWRKRWLELAEKFKNKETK